ncbi:hypothetical protein QUB10_03590 [Microcoleus sp. B5-D4]|uniref:hypothetical protein n=1 Tax=unclassified Microcoleus TaxID=2642155 RepID=UPI002FD1702B
MDNSVRPNLRYCIIIIKVKAIDEGSSATDYVTDVTDVRKNGEGRRKTEQSQGFH